MRKYLREHIVRAVNNFAQATGESRNFGVPLDSHLREYCRQYKSRRRPSAVGARDRKELKDLVYDIVRHRGMLEKLAKSPENIEEMIELVRSKEFENQRRNPSFEEWPLPQQTRPLQLPQSAVRHDRPRPRQPQSLQHLRNAQRPGPADHPREPAEGLPRPGSRC